MSGPEIVDNSEAIYRPLRIIRKVVSPTLTVLLPEHPNGTSLIIAPGGGYTRIELDQEGRESGMAFLPHGVTVFLMTYRLPGEGHKNGADVPLQDAQRAVRLIRAHAADWKLDPDRIGILGFSAAGHLAASLATGFDRQVYAPMDAFDLQSARPDFVVLMYPVISMQDGTAHENSRKALLGGAADEDRKVRYSPELHVGSSTPQTFIALAGNDDAVPPENSLGFYLALREAGIPADLHVFSDGGHGFGIAAAGTRPAHNWPEVCLWWLGSIGML